MGDPNVQRIGLKYFRESGLLWWTNRFLHVFGIALAVEVGENGELSQLYPVKCKFRGFTEQSEQKGFGNITKYLKQNIERMEKEANE